MVLWAFLIIRGFAPSLYKHIQLPINLTYTMGLLACIPSLVCIFGMFLKKQWSLPLSIFLFAYIAVILILFVQGIFQVGAYRNHSDLAVYFLLIALTIFMACTFAFNDRVKKFFGYRGTKDFLHYLFRFKKTLIISFAIFIIFEVLIVKQYRYYQQYPWPPPEIANAEIHKKRPFFVKGNISNQDIDEIVEMVNNMNKIDTKILYVIKNEEGSVKVITGELKAPLWGGGNDILLKKEHNDWKVIEIGSWLSYIELPNKCVEQTA